MLKSLIQLLKQFRCYLNDRKIRSQYPETSHIESAFSWIDYGEPDKARESLRQAPEGHVEKYLLSAKLDLFSANYEEGIQHTQQLLNRLPIYSSFYKDAFFLRQRIWRAKSEHKIALQEILDCPFKEYSARFFRNFRRNIVHKKDIQLYEHVMEKLGSGDKGWATSRRHYLMLLSELGQEGEAQTKANSFLKNNNTSLKHNLSKRQYRNCDTEQVRWKEKARKAILDLKKTLDQEKIEFFLISGSLLGCIREKDILSHDYDIDIGIDESVSFEKVCNALEKNNCFLVKESSWKFTIHINHINGVNIDIFRHYVEGNYYWHEGKQCRWWNSKFELRNTLFLGHKFKIPGDYKMYLNENYNEWEKPTTNFNVYNDTPNAELKKSTYSAWLK